MSYCSSVSVRVLKAPFGSRASTAAVSFDSDLLGLSGVSLQRFDVTLSAMASKFSEPQTSDDGGR